MTQREESSMGDVAEALRPVANAFVQLGVEFYVGGSVASSFHGAMRSTMDIDLVAKLDVASVGQLVSKLGTEYYTNEVAIRDAVHRKSSFNLIHLVTSFKVDVFAFRGRPFDVSAFARARHGQIGADPNFSSPIASAEDTILAKLEWYRLGNETSERQWQDVTNVLKLLGTAAEIDYLRNYAMGVGVRDLVERLLDECGLG